MTMSSFQTLGRQRGFAIIAGLLLGGCTAEISGHGGGAPPAAAAGAGNNGPGAGPTGTPADLGSPPKVPGAPAVESAGIMPLLRLTHREYDNTMTDLLGDTSHPGQEFETDIPGRAGYDAPSMVATENARQYMQSAEALAARVITDRKLSLPCSNPADSAAETSCVTQ